MLEVHKTYLNWSTGKDSALALYHLQQGANYQVEYLLTSVNVHYQRVSMHGVRTALLQQQVQALGIPGGTVELPKHTTNEVYEQEMGKKITELKTTGFTHAAFGDIFLEDLRQYREQQLGPFYIQTVFPLWKKDTRQLVEEFIELGFQAIVVCVNAGRLDRSFAGRLIDRDFINDLPPGVDPCGENGEFHTFCFDGPIFQQPVLFSPGEVVYKEYIMDAQKTGFGFATSPRY